MRDQLEDNRASSPVTSYNENHHLQYSPHKVVDNIMATLNAKIDSSDTELSVAWSSTAERVQTLEKKLTSAMSQLVNWNIERENANSKINALHIQNEALAEELNRSKLQYISHNSRVRTLEGDLSVSNSRFLLQDRFLNNQNVSLVESSRLSHELQCKLDASNATINGFRQEIEALNDKLNKSKSDDTQDNEKLQGLLTIIDEKSKIIEGLEGRIQENQEPECDHSVFDKKVLHLEKVLDEKNQEIDSLNGKMKCFEVAEEHLEKLRTELMMKNSRLDSMDFELKSLRSQYLSSKIQKDDQPIVQDTKDIDTKIMEKNELLKIQLDETKTKIGHLLLENDTLKKSLEEAQSSLGASQLVSQAPAGPSPAEMTTIKKELNQIRDSYNKAKDELEDVRGDLSIAETANKDLRSLKNNLQQQLDQSSKIKGDLNTQLIMKDSQLIMTKGQIHDIK